MQKRKTEKVACLNCFCHVSDELNKRKTITGKTLQCMLDCDWWKSARANCLIVGVVIVSCVHLFQPLTRDIKESELFSPVETFN